MKSYYAVLEKFSNVERIYSFDSACDRDSAVNEHDTMFAINYKELLARLALNRKIARSHRNDSGWVNGLPETMSEIEPYR